MPAFLLPMLLRGFGFVKEAFRAAIGFLEPRPIFTVYDHADRRLFDAESIRELFLGDFTGHSANKSNVSLTQFRIGTLLAKVHGSVRKLVVSIFAGGSPAQVARVTTPISSVSAIVRRVVLRTGWRTVSIFTSDSVSALIFFVKNQLAVSVSISRVWPNETIIPVKRQDVFIEEPQRLSILGFWRWFSGGWVSMHRPAPVVVFTPPSPMGRLATTINGAYRLISHGAVLSHSGQGRGLFAQPFRPASYARFTLRSQGELV